MVGGMAPRNEGKNREAEMASLENVYLQQTVGDVLQAFKGVAEEAAPTTLTFELPASMSHYAHDIRRFVDAMLYKLEKNAAKGKWEKYTVEEAFDLLEGEVAELRAEIGGNAVKTLLESADVANFALMIANIATERGK